MGDLPLRNNLDSTFVSETKKVSPPYIFIPKYGEEIALIITCLEPGPIPILLSDGGVLKQVGSCSLSALELAKLLRVYHFEVVKSQSEKVTITQITDILEVLPWMASLLFS